MWMKIEAMRWDAPKNLESEKRRGLRGEPKGHQTYKTIRGKGACRGV